MSFAAILTRDAGLVQARLDRALAGLSDQPVIHAMRYAVRGGIVLEIEVLDHGLADIPAVSRRLAMFLFERLGSAVLVDRGQARKQPLLDKLLQAFGEFLAGALIMVGAGQGSMFVLLKGIDHIHRR